MSIGNSFLDQFVPALAATLIGGGVLLVVAYQSVDLRLDLRGAKRRLEEERKQQEAVCRAALGVALDELERISKRIDPWADAVQRDIVPYPVFDTNGWAVLLEARVLAGLRAETSVPLIKAYERIRAANGRLELFTELSQGSTAVSHLTAVAAARRRRAVRKVAMQVEGFRSERRDRLVIRLNELHPYVNAAITAIKAELDRLGDAP